MLPARPTALDALLHIPHNQQVAGMGLRAAVQQLQSRKSSTKHTQLRIQPLRNAVVLHAVLERHSAAAATAELRPHTTPQAFYMSGMQDGTQQQQQHDATSLAQSSLRHRLLQRPSRGALQTPQQQQQQQQQGPAYQQAPTAGPQEPELQAAAAAAAAQSPAAPSPPAELASASAGGQQTARELLFDEIAAATSLHQLQQLFPRVAAVGLPELTTVLLLQAVRVVRSGEAACLVPVLQPWAQQHSRTRQQGVPVQQQQQQQEQGLQQQLWQQPQQDSGRQQKQQQHLEQQWQQPRRQGLQHEQLLQQRQQQQQQHEQLQLQQQQEQHQQEGHAGAGSAELQQLLASVNVLLGRQCPMLQFQHISGVLWAWSQLGWRPAEGQAGIGLRSILRRLIECPVQRETSGQYSQVGPQLARAIVGCATLNIKDPAVWQKLHSITQAAAQLLQQRELALCAWGMARSRMPLTTHSIAAWSALLQRAQDITAAAGVGAGAGFDRVAALNLSWAVLVARVAHLCPASWLGVLVQQALGPSYQAWLQQQQDWQQGTAGVTRSTSSSGRNMAQLTPALSAPAASAGVSAAAVGRAGSSADADGGAVSDLLPQELCCLYWTLAAAAKQQQAILDSPSTHHDKATAAAAPAGPMQQEGRGRAALTALEKQQLAHLQQQWCCDVAIVLHDQQLQGYLAAAVVQQLPVLHPQHVSQLARTAAVLHQQHGTGAPAIRAAVGAASAVAAASAAARGAESDGSRRVREQLGVALLQQIWERVLQDARSNRLEGYRLSDICMLLQSVAAMQHHLQHQQQQQGDRAAAALPAVAADVIAAVMQRVQSAHPSELHPRTATLLLHELAVLCRAANRGGPSILQAAVSAAAAGVVVRLSHATCAAGGLAHLRDKELVLAAVAAGQLASAQAATTPNQQLLPPSSDSSGRPSSQSRVLQLLLQQLALPLAAVAPSLKLRSLANVACAYAAAGQSPPELFDAVADAVQDSGVLHRGSSWALARTLAAYAAVGYVDEGLFGAVADALLPRLRAGTLRPRVVAKLAAALAAGGYHDAAVFQEVAAAVLAAAGRGTKPVPAQAKPVAPSAAVSTAAALPPPTHELEASGSMAQRRPLPAPVAVPVMPVYAAQDVSNLSWALATAGFKAVEPFKVLAAVGEQQMLCMSTSQMANLLWGCAVAGVKRSSLLAAAATHLTQPTAAADSTGGCSRLAGASASDVATIAWSLTKLGVCDRGVMAECVRHFLARRQHYSPGDAAGLACALAWSNTPSWVLLPTGSQALAGKPGQHSRGVDEHAGAGSNSSRIGSGGSSRQQGREVVSARDVLGQLLGVCGSDVDALSPQQLASMGLVQAALQAGCIADHGGEGLAADTYADGTGSSGSSSVRDSSGSGFAGSGGVAGGAFYQQLWPNVASWGPTAFSAADGVKLLWASLLTAGLQQHQQLTAGPAVKGVDATKAKLLGAGARALVHQTAAVCSSQLGQQVLKAIHALNLPAHPAIQPQQPAAATIQRRGSSSATVTAAAAAAAAAAVTAALAAPSSGRTSSSSGGGSGGSDDKPWQRLGPEVTAQLLGHIVIGVPAALVQAVSTQLHEGGPQHTHGEHPPAAAAGQQQSMSGEGPAGVASTGGQVPLLLHLVAATDICGPVHGGAAAAEQQGLLAAAGQQGFVEARPQLLGWHAVVGGAVLQQQPHYVGVVLTQLEWEAWGGQQTMKLHELLAQVAAASQLREAS